MSKRDMAELSGATHAGTSGHLGITALMMASVIRSISGTLSSYAVYLRLTRFGGHRSKGGYGVDHGRGEEAEAATTELHRRVQGRSGAAGARRWQDHPAGGA